MEYNPEDLEIHERYRLLIGGVVPRPIAFVSTVSADGAPNLAPFSFFNAIGSNPMTLLFCPVNPPDGSEKDTLKNAKPTSEGGTGEFVVHVATEELAREVAGAAEDLAHGESEFELVGLETAPCRKVKPPRVVRSPIAYECTTEQVIRTNPGAPGGGNIVIGRVVHVHVDDAVLDPNGRIDPDRLRAIGRMAGADYSTTRDRFEMPRGRTALDLDDPFDGKS